MSALVTVGLGCALLQVDARFALRDGVVLEHTVARVRIDDDRCTEIGLPLPRGSELVGAEGRARLSDDTRRNLGAIPADPRSARRDDVRWERVRGALHSEPSVKVHVPDLLRKDEVVLEVRRKWTHAPVLAQEADWIRVRAPGLGISGRGADGSMLTASPISADDRIRLDVPGLDDAEPLDVSAPLAKDVGVRRTLTLHVPPGDPQQRLFPGGGSWVEVDEQVSFPPTPEPRSWWVPLREGASEVAVLAPGVTHEVRVDGVAIAVPASEGPLGLGLRYRAPDAPTYGSVSQRGGEHLTLEVRAPGGTVVWEDDGSAWYLAGWGEKAVLPSRAALVKALDNRFRALSVPEPGLPMRIRGLPSSWELVAALPGLVHERVAVADWPVDALWPRKPVRARKSGVATPTEAALILQIYALQAKLPAELYLVRPSALGPAPAVAPIGYSEALVRVFHAGEWRWMDPACTVCAPFEVRPELLGSSALGRELESTPPPEPGRLLAEVEAGTVRWRLEGAAALSLRRWLTSLPAEGRSRAVAERVAGEDGVLIEATGVEQPGEPITLVARGTPRAPYDPLDAWVGERILRYPGEAEPVARPGYSRHSGQGIVTETWTVPVP